ncbi:armadillo-type protein [Amylostereum chailletii]|nr:armadillo-type protein [Amylostereum chailletii]
MAILEDVPPDPPPSYPDPLQGLPDELSYLTGAFTPDQDAAQRSKAYLVLASFCQGVRASSPPKGEGETDPGTENLSRKLSVAVARIADPDEKDILAGLSFLSALFQVDWQAAASLFSQDHILTAITDVLDLYPSESVSRECARLLSQASGHKSCRAVLPSDCLKWLESTLAKTKDPSLRASAAIAVVKLSRGAKSDAADLPKGELVDSSGADRELVDMMKGLVVSGDKDSLSDAVEGLAYLSVEPVVKESLVDDPTFLSRLFSFAVPRKGATPASPEYLSHTILYGVLMIISNLSTYRPRLSAEDAQIEKLRRMAKAGSGSASKAGGKGDDVLEDDEHAKRRGSKIVQYGGLNVLTTALRVSDSEGMRLTVAKALLSLVEDKENRGRVLQSGGARALVDVIRKSLPTSPSEEKEPDSTILTPIQALAKLAITASPVQVFGPDSGAIHDSIRPFAILLSHTSSSLLQRFEAMMALTNISSHSAEAAERVAKAKGLVSKVEFLMLEDHALIRRAATELLCNLMAGSDEIFDRYAGDGSSDGAKSKLHVLLALSDVDDLPTRLAASGALATLTASPHACRSLYSLEQEHGRVIRTFVQLIDPSILDTHDDQDRDGSSFAPSDPGLVHRGVVCIQNFLENLDAELVTSLIGTPEAKLLLQALVKVLKENGGKPEVLRPTAEALKRLMNVGMELPT